MRVQSQEHTPKQPSTTVCKLVLWSIEYDEDDEDDEDGNSQGGQDAKHRVKTNARAPSKGSNGKAVRPCQHVRRTGRNTLHLEDTYGTPNGPRMSVVIK